MKLVIYMSLLASFSLTACSTIIRRNTESVSFTSNPNGATVTTTTGSNCTTPCNAEIKRNKDFVATFTLGNETKTINVDTKASFSTSAASVVANTVAGGVIGLGVDIGSGALKDHRPNPVHVDFSGTYQNSSFQKPSSQCPNDAVLIGGAGYCL